MSPTRKTTSTGAATAATTPAAPAGKPAAKSATSTKAPAKTQAAKAPAEPARRVTGSVAFVGIGPGDPGLFTLRALELLRDAEVVVLSESGREQLLAHCPAAVTVADGAFDAEGVPLAPAARAKVITTAAKSGKRVVRLVDGDGGLTGHVAEEAAACVKAGLAFQLVPGVSPVTAVPAFAGVPLTSRSVREVRVVDVTDSKIDWASVASKDATLVLSGTTERALVAGAVAKLIEAGLDPATPVITTWAGTTTEQRTVAGTLVDIAAALPSGTLCPSAVTVVGEVVDLRETLSWFETRPLFGWRVLVPRTKEQSGALSVRLRSYGAVPEEVPTISVEPPRTPQQMERAIKGLVTGRYEWVAFTSRNAVKAVREKFEEYGLDARAFSGIKVAAVGEQTAGDLAAWGIRADLVPSGEQSARGLLEDWPPYDEVFDPINRVFLPRADIATDVLVAGLVNLGWEVDDVTAYRTVRAAPPPAPVREAIKGGGFDAVVFTSSSTVRNLVGIAGKPHTSTIIACIGPATAAEATEHGLRVDVLAATPSARELADALANFGAARRAAAAENGESVLRPSEKRTSARRRR
ncbi:bifunctional uroporphyrinogen-III C-methyltransferase/uroporphyrinogen-III synthase [Sporichthya sp.]|uniref:uroporphyrinogen-III synthase n=1 Tax=Sporichthya sp. TaxID=65475 RepID=UPI0017D6FDA8|nr:bifunctional uroporphyrinogen-III C-methyltransferase/uroporphyrinogen-III synthase [Sporichthya sp.]MBA3745263.1 bifunctional uroporphyrinogen-III C-methyltransferase/uroporphyrinogen-III synthase [Sporichthya sp.]